ncbi:hypothetical protein MAR_002971, partial [Mya arenaria]
MFENVFKAQYMNTVSPRLECNPYACIMSTILRKQEIPFVFPTVVPILSMDTTKESGEQFADDGNNNASHDVLAMAGNIREAYSNDKKDLHFLKHDVKGQLRELEQQMTNLIENLTTNVKQSEQIDLRLNETEAKLNESISSTFRQNEEKLQRSNIEITNDNYYYPCAKDIRLANAHQYRNGEIVGRLEASVTMMNGAHCATICIYTLNVNVVCRTFGFRECDYIVTSYCWRMGSKKKWMDNVKCLGTESSILECPHDGWE